MQINWSLIWIVCFMVWTQKWMALNYQSSIVLIITLTPMTIQLLQRSNSLNTATIFWSILFSPSLSIVNSPLTFQLYQSVRSLINVKISVVKEIAIDFGSLVQAQWMNESQLKSEILAILFIMDLKIISTWKDTCRRGLLLKRSKSIWS